MAELKTHIAGRIDSSDDEDDETLSVVFERVNSSVQQDASNATKKSKSCSSKNVVYNDFGPVTEIEINVCTNRPNQTVIIYECRKDIGKFLVFSRNKMKRLANGLFVGYYVCFHCDGKNNGSRVARVTVHEGKFVTNPENGHSPNCAPISEIELDILAFRKKVVDYGNDNFLNPLQAYKGCLEKLMNKYAEESSQAFLLKSIPEFKTIRTILYRHIKLYRPPKKKAILDPKQDFGEALFLTTIHHNRQLLAYRSRNALSSPLQMSGSFYIFMKNKTKRLATDNAFVYYFVCIGCDRLPKNGDDTSASSSRPKKTARVTVKAGRIVTDPEEGHDERCKPISAAQLQALQIKREILYASAEIGGQPSTAYDQCVKQILAQYADDEHIQRSVAANIPSYEQLRPAIHRATSKNRLGRTTLVPLPSSIESLAGSSTNVIHAIQTPAEI